MKGANVTSGQFNSMKMRGINKVRVICKVSIWRRSLTADRNRVTVTVGQGFAAAFVTDTTDVPRYRLVFSSSPDNGH
jgi:hypothetical protein